MNKGIAAYNRAQKGKFGGVNVEIEKTQIITAAEIFKKAATYIRQYGWQEKGMSEHGKPRCSMGALASAYPELLWNPAMAALMYKALYNELNGINLTQFNARAKNGEEVARLFERTAASLLIQQTTR